MIPTLALELAPRRIRVNAVSPGFTDTPMMRTTPGMGSDEVAAMLAATAAKNPFGRVGRPEDIAETVAFLASDGAAYITGQEFVVSGVAVLAVCPNYRQSTDTFLSVPGATDLARDQTDIRQTAGFPCPLRNGGGLVDVPGRGLLAAKGESPLRVPICREARADHRLVAGRMRPSVTWRWESAQHGYVCAVVLVASQHVSVVWSCGVTGSASGSLEMSRTPSSTPLPERRRGSE